MTEALLVLPLGLISVSALLFLAYKQEAVMQKRCVCGHTDETHDGQGCYSQSMKVDPHSIYDPIVDLCGCPRFTSPKIVSRRA